MVSAGFAAITLAHGKYVWKDCPPCSTDHTEKTQRLPKYTQQSEKMGTASAIPLALLKAV